MKAHEESGQATVEFAIIAIVFVGIIVGIGTLFSLAREGSFVVHAEGSASHSLSAHNAAGVVGDVLLY